MKILRDRQASNVSLGGGSRELVSSRSLNHSEPFECLLPFAASTGVTALVLPNPSFCFFLSVQLNFSAFLCIHPARVLPRTTERRILGLHTPDSRLAALPLQLPPPKHRVPSPLIPFRHLCFAPHFASPFLTTSSTISSLDSSSTQLTSLLHIYTIHCAHTYHQYRTAAQLATLHHPTRTSHTPRI